MESVSANFAAMRDEESPMRAITVDAVRAERIAQGLPATIEDPETLALIASALRSITTRSEVAA
jgi:hypothetical protein